MEPLKKAQLLKNTKQLQEVFLTGVVKNINFLRKYKKKNSYDSLKIRRLI